MAPSRRTITVNSGHISTSMLRQEMAFRHFLRVYEQSNPRPNYGWMTRITAIAIIALTLVAALRSAFSFGLSAFTSLNQFLTGQVSPELLLFLSDPESFAAILGIEGFIIVTGMKNGMNKKDDEMKAPRAIASYFLLVVSCAAGMFQKNLLPPVRTSCDHISPGQVSWPGFLF